MAKKPNKKSDFELGDFGVGDDFGSLFGDAGQYAPTDYGLGIGPEEGSFIGPGGTDPNGFTPGDYRDLEDINASGEDVPHGGGGGGGGGSSGGGTLSQIARALGLVSGSGDGSVNWAQILSMLGLGAGALTQHHATQEATRLAQEGIANASAQASSTIGGAQANFTPYINAGQSAAGRIASMPLSNLAANYKPIGSGKGLNLAQIVKG